MSAPFLKETRQTAPKPPFSHRRLLPPQEAWRREHLRRLWLRLGAALGVAAESPIVPLLVGSEAAAVAVSAQLLARGLHVPAIRPPTVPAGTSRWVYHTLA